MALGNTADSYGTAARTLHWLTALLIFIAFPLGLLANRAELSDAAAIERAYKLFSLHKTVGMVALSIGLLRILWSLTQPRPAPLHPERRAETFLAATAHWTLTLALILVPISGWLTHAAEPGLAPILGPFPQTLSSVPKDPELARMAGAVHWLATKLLGIAILLHVAGAVKHALVDRDQTLDRMWRGTRAGTGARDGTWAPALSAAAIWLAALAAGAALAPPPPAGPPVTWQTADLRLTLIRQADGLELGEVPASDLTLSLAEDGTGTLDLFAALDSVTAPEADPLLNALPIPVLQFAGQVTGTPPALGASGTTELGGVTAPQDIPITLEGDNASIDTEVTLPGAPEGFALSLKATMLRP